MISNQILQNTIEGIKGITKIELYVMDTDGNVLAETSADAVRYEDSIQSFVDSPADSQVLQGYQFFKTPKRYTPSARLLCSRSRLCWWLTKNDTIKIISSKTFC